MRLFERLRRIFRRRDRDWQWTIPGSLQYLHSTDQADSFSMPAARVTYPDPVPEAPPEARLTAFSNAEVAPPQPNPVGVVSMEAEPEPEPEPQAMLVAEERPYDDLPYVPVVEAALRRGKVVLGFEDGKVMLESSHPFIKDFIRAADRMMKPGRRLSWKKARFEGASV